MYISSIVCKTVYRVLFTIMTYKFISIFVPVQYGIHIILLISINNGDVYSNTN